MSAWDELAERAAKLRQSRAAGWDRLEAERGNGAEAERLAELHSRAEGFRESIARTEGRMVELEGRELRLELRPAPPSTVPVSRAAPMPQGRPPPPLKWEPFGLPIPSLPASQWNQHPYNPRLPGWWFD